jgi:RNA polymerase sigma-70 factor (ECF subfamily)
VSARPDIVTPSPLVTSFWCPFARCDPCVLKRSFGLKGSHSGWCSISLKIAFQWNRIAERRRHILHSPMREPSDSRLFSHRRYSRRHLDSQSSFHEQYQPVRRYSERPQYEPPVTELPNVTTGAPPPSSGPTHSPATFESLLASVVDSAFGTAVQLTRNRTDAEDLVQEAALLAFRSFTTFEPGSNFKGWFFRILTDCYFSRYRREKSQPSTLDLDDTPDLYLYARSGEAGFPTQGPDPAALLLEQLGTERVIAAIDRLPEEYRVVSTLYFMEDFSYEEIARVLHCPVGTVRSRLHRGRKMLQKALWQIAEEDGIVSQPSHFAES